MDQTSPSGWPVVEVDASTVPAEAAPWLICEALLAALDRGGMFAAVIRMPEPGQRGRKPAGIAERVRMLKRLRPGLGARCRGLAFVVSLAAQQENAKAIRAGRKMWGCPTMATDDPAHARSWVRAQLDTAPADPVSEA